MPSAQDIMDAIGKLTGVLNDTVTAQSQMRSDISELFKRADDPKDREEFDMEPIDFMAQEAEIDGKLLARLRPYDPRHGCKMHRCRWKDNTYELGRWYTVDKEQAEQMELVLQDHEDEFSPMAFEIVEPREAARLDAIDRREIFHGDANNPLKPGARGRRATAAKLRMSGRRHNPNPGRSTVAVRER